MNEFTKEELQLIIFLCFQRKSVVGMEKCEDEGTGDLYRKTCCMLREDNNE